MNWIYKLFFFSSYILSLTDLLGSQDHRRIKLSAQNGVSTRQISNFINVSSKPLNKKSSNSTVSGLILYLADPIVMVPISLSDPCLPPRAITAPDRAISCDFLRGILVLYGCTVTVLVTGLQHLSRFLHLSHEVIYSGGTERHAADLGNLGKRSWTQITR